MSKRTLSQIGGIVLWGLWTFLAVPSCVIKIGPGGTGDDTHSGNTNSNDAGSGDPAKSEQEIGEETYNQLDPQELAIASAKAGYMTCSLSGTIDALNLDPATLDDATIVALIEQYGPTIAADTEAWLSSVDPSTLVYTKVPPYSCVENYGCVYSAKCKYGYVPSVSHICFIDDCGEAKCRSCPDFINGFLQNVAIKAWCSYVCVEGGSYPPKVVAAGGGGVSKLFGTFVGLYCIP